MKQPLFLLSLSFCINTSHLRHFPLPVPAIKTAFPTIQDNNYVGRSPRSTGTTVNLSAHLSLLLSSLSLFSYNQRRRGDAAAFPPRLIKNRNVIAGAIFTMCSNSDTNALEYYLPSYYVREHSPFISGYMMIPIVVGATIGMLLCGSRNSTIGYYSPFMIFSSLLTPIFAGLITALELARALYD
jgi:hypothetical protein